MDVTPGRAEKKPIATSAVWPVPRTTAIPRAADEFTMLKAYLEHYQETFELKCAGVPPARLSDRSSPPSTMSLHGLTRHLAGVERWWFAINFAGLDLPMLHYSDECERSRGIVEGAWLDAVGDVERNGSYTLRWLMLRMIAEYAQHAGHADFLREGIDGAVGA